MSEAQGNDGIDIEDRSLDAPRHWEPMILTSLGFYCHRSRVIWLSSLDMSSTVYIVFLK